MKSHLTKEQCFKKSKVPLDQKEAFFMGWYACGNEINQGEDSDWLQERLYAEDFLRKPQNVEDDDE